MTFSRLHWLYALQGIGLGLLMPFLVPLLDEKGLSAAQIGFVLGGAGFISLLAYPLWGTLADGWLGRRRSIALTGATAAAGGLLILNAGTDPVTLTLALSVAFIGALPWGPLIDALALGQLGEESSTYGRLRVWASLGWAGSTISAGIIWTVLGSSAVLALFLLAALGVAAVGIWQQEPAAHVHDGEQDRPGLRHSLPLIATPILLGFMLGLFVSSVGEFATWRFVGLRILDQGGGVLLIGLAASLPALIEVPVFASSRGLTQRFGLRGIFLGGALISSSLAFLIAFAPEAWMVALFRTIDGTSFALRYMGMVLIIAALLPRRLHAVGQSLGWLVGMGIAPIVADAAGGFIYDAYGPTILFLTAAALILVGGVIVWFVLSGARFRRQGT